MANARKLVRAKINTFKVVTQLWSKTIVQNGTLTLNLAIQRKSKLERTCLHKNHPRYLQSEPSVSVPGGAPRSHQGITRKGDFHRGWPIFYRGRKMFKVLSHNLMAYGQNSPGISNIKLTGEGPIFRFSMGRHCSDSRSNGEVTVVDLTGSLRQDV